MASFRRLSSDLRLRRVLVSAGIPEDDWTDAPFQRHEITQAVVAVARAILKGNGNLVFGGHPLITPLIFDVSGEIIATQEDKSDRVVLYQSAYFGDVLPATVWNFRQAAWASVHDIPPAIVGADAQPSLVRMRQAMLDPKLSLHAAVMIGVAEEYRMVRAGFPNIPIYTLKRPGGTAAAIPPSNVDLKLALQLGASAAYVDLARRIVADIAGRNA